MRGRVAGRDWWAGLGRWAARPTPDSWPVLLPAGPSTTLLLAVGQYNPSSSLALYNDTLLLLSGIAAFIVIQSIRMQLATGVEDPTN